MSCRRATSTTLASAARLSSTIRCFSAGVQRRRRSGPGKTVTLVNRANGKDLKLTDNGDGTLTAVTFGTGNTVLYGPDGKAIARNPGQSRFELLIDQRGTPTDPSDDELISIELVKGSTGRSDDICAAAIEALT